MDISKLLEQLAAQLHTTVAYLWSILLRQAHAQIILDTGFIIATVIYGIILWRIHIYLLKERKFGDSSYTESIYEKHDGAAYAPMFVGLMLFVILFIGLCFSVWEIFQCLLNPEYWALNQILEKLYKK